jgi:hypothetical protein
MEDCNDYQKMQQKMGADHGDTITRLDTLFKTALPEKYADALARVCSIARMRYLGDHEVLNFEDVLEILEWVPSAETWALTHSYDLQPKRWTAAEDLLDGENLDSKCATIQKSKHTITPGTKMSENNVEERGKSSGLRASFKRLLRHGRGSAAASGDSK